MHWEAIGRYPILLKDKFKVFCKQATSKANDYFIIN